ncbi:glycosyltransferase family 2 protein [Methylophilales bacterium]|nr:glycosyltransferase family 2 protein [Methylophilales bacterium]
MKKILSVVLPVYNNETSINQLVSKLFLLEKKLSNYSLNIIMVDDGSIDSSWERMNDIHRKYKNIKILKLTRNFGQLNAIIAGLKFSNYGLAVVMSADLQDPPEIIKKLVDEYEKKFEIVIAARRKRDDGFLTNFFSRIAWKVLNKINSFKIPTGGFDYFLISENVKEIINKSHNKEVFIQGKILNTGYSSSIIYYDRQKRVHGKSQASFTKKIKYLIDGVFAYSILPIKFISIFSMILFLLSFIASVFYFSIYFMFDNLIPGWTTIIVGMFLLFSFNFLILSFLGEYLWRINLNTNEEDTYVIEKIIEPLKK